MGLGVTDVAAWLGAYAETISENAAAMRTAFTGAPPWGT